MSENIVKGKTSTGFEFEIKKDTLEDVELSDALCMMADSQNEDTQMAGSYRFKNLLLGADQLKRLYTHIRKKNGGKCTNEMVNDELHSIMEACKELKN